MRDPDHRYMSPPFIRISRRRPVGTENTVCVWDLRVGQPNVTHLPPAAIHSLEHFMGVLLPQCTPDIINVAPMGCQTGFYIVSINLDDIDVMSKHLATTFEQVLEATSVPLANSRECGWAENHSLIGAQEVAAWLLRQRKNWKMVLFDDA